MLQCKSFCHSKCIDGTCPNAQIEALDNMYGAGIADDCGMTYISCSKCGYKTGTCEECIFDKSKDCVKYKNNR